MNFSDPGHPFIIVQKFTQGTIEEAIKAYAKNDAYWSKFRHFAGDIDISIFNKLQVKHIFRLL
jgi:hypothetical protein